jgi:hypothetical protein
MLASQLKEITEIDQCIEDMHRELAQLYARRSAILQPAVDEPQSAASSKVQINSETWAEQEYARLSQLWQTCGINVPAYRTLQKRLSKARQVMEDMAAADKRLRGNLSVVLVPPTKLLPFPFTAEARRHQQFIKTNDYVSYELSDVAPSAKWRVLVVYNQPEGLPIRTPKDVIASKQYMIGGHDARAFGAYEYAAFSIHAEQPIEQNSWAVLFHEQREDGLLPCVTFTDGRFFFDLDDMDNLFGDDYYRPAVEVN